ncbi:MAG TPA: tetratricopeptide repeat protein [Kofleriaceae bacterium]
MSCPSVEQLAAVAAGEALGAAEHAKACAVCSAIVAEQGEIRMLARQLETPRLSATQRAKLAQFDQGLGELMPAPQLDPDRKKRLAAETMARADTQVTLVVPKRRWPWLAAGGLAAAAAVAAVVLAASGHDAPVTTVAVQMPVVVETPAPAPIATPAPAPAPVVHERVAAAKSTPTTIAKSIATSTSNVAAKVTGNADYSRIGNGVVLRDGTISIDARDRASVAVAVGDTKIRVNNAHVEIKARNGVIVSAHSFAGSIERSSPESKAMIQSGEEWAPTPREAALAAFRIGWRALHEGRNGDALAAFERASDPVVAEESAFWAAVAAQRAGNHEEAMQRFRVFLDAYPQSTRAEAARAGLAQ